MSVVFLYGMKDNIVKTSTLLSRSLLLVTKRTLPMGTIDRYMVYETDEGDTVNSAPEPEGDGDTNW